MLRRKHARGIGKAGSSGEAQRWCFREIQRQIEYKARWEGIEVVYVSAPNTSRTCSQCGAVNRALRFERA